MREATSNVALPTVRIGGFKTVRVTRTDLAKRMVDDCMRARDPEGQHVPQLVFSSNGQGIALAGQDSNFKQTMNQADIIHADGMPVVLASRLTAARLPDRIATTDFFHDAALAASQSGLRFFFLGASEEQNAKAVAKVREMYPELQIAGRHHGYFAPDDADRVCASILESKADVVWVALGKPRQEHWCVEMRDKLPGVGWLKTCGGLYAFLTGDAPRAPRWMQSLGLEWLYRTVDDPKRLIWRYATTNPYAFFRILRHTDWRRPRRTRRNND